jgi:class 3 adenylate cyclase
MSLTPAQNDALWAVKMGKAPNDAQAKEIQAAAAKIGTDQSMAAGALVRMLGGYGADAPLVEMLKAQCEAKEVSEDLIAMLDQFADEEAEKPDSFDISQMSNILNLLVDVEELEDPATRPVEESAADGDGDDEEPKTCAGLQNFLDATPWQIFTALITAWALFATDIALAFMSKSADYGIAVVTFIAFIGFAFEFISNIVSGRDYGSDMGNLFFWLDAIGTFSLIPDFLILFMDEEMEVNDNVTLARVARAARIGARLSRLTKVFRVKDGQSSFTSMMADNGIDLEEDEGDTEVASQVGAQVADGISKKVVILVITLLVFIPIFTYHEPAGGIRQTKEEAVAMLKSIKDSTSPGLGKCYPGLPVRNTDPLVDGAPYAGYPMIGKTRAEKVAADWSPCCGMKPNFDDATLANSDQTAYHPDNLIPNDDCIATCTEPVVPGSVVPPLQKYPGTCEETDTFFAGMPEAERLSLVEFLQLQGDRVIMFTWDRGIAKGEEEAKALCEADADCASFEEYKSSNEACLSYTCASDDFVPPKPMIGEESPKDDAPAHGPGLFFKMSRRFYELREVEIRRYGDTVEECTVANNCMTEEESMKKPETTYNMEGLEFWVDLSEQTKSEATTQIAYMWFIIVIFAIASLVFMSSLQTMVIEPVEGMTKAMTMVTKSLIDLGGSGSNTDGEAAYIESSILKIVGLLNVSFGEAGTKIIQRNMSQGSSELNSAVPGEKVTAVYGMSDIREFTATTEALNQDIVLFVNEFANICHGQCIKTGGAPNKNVGDAFLCVWKDKDSVLCDKALEAYRQAIQKIRSSQKLTKLIARPDIAKRFPDAEREFGTYLPAMGFGLHHGTSVEGAIGTSLKMDAAYLGADVDLSDVLEIQTKEYKAPILMSEAFFNQLSEPVQKTCRKVDRVLAGAASEPFMLYAANVASVDGSFFDRGIEEDVFVTDEQGEEDGTADASGADGRWDALVDPWNDEFETAVDAYIAGDWAAASKSLSASLDERPWDGPALKLQEFIRANGGKAPRGWKGYQEI